MFNLGRRTIQHQPTISENSGRI